MCTAVWSRIIGGNGSEAADEEKKRTKKIDKMLAESKKQMTTVFRMLLLGPGDSGKSTIVKQMRILHANGFDQEETAAQQSIIAGNILTAISAILKAMDDFGIKFQNSEREVSLEFCLGLADILTADAKYILEKSWIFGSQLDAGDWVRLKRLWQDPDLQACFLRSNEFQVADSTQYFCDQIDRYASPDFAPNEQDMLRSRSATLGIVEFDFTLRGLSCKVIDVGGQRSQRKKWIHCFESVNALIFVASLSEYNQVLLEDNKVNRAHESLKLFNTVINCQWFRQTPVVLFLNKKDLFEEKLKRFPMSNVFSDYKGGVDYSEGVKFMEQLYNKQKQDLDKVIYVHKTCATDTRNVEFVLDACFDILLAKSLARTGMDM